MKRTLSIFRLAGFAALAWLFTLPIPVWGQTVSPLMGIGSVYFTDGNGNPSQGALYVFAAGTTTQAPSYVDSAGQNLNPNPVPLSSGRATIWVSTSGFFKYVLCSVSTDGPTCAPADTLFTVDNVPGGSSGGGGGSSPFTGTFISGTASPSTTGILRLASGDTVCFRNAAGSSNLCWSKDGNDLLSWAGGSLKFPEVNCPSGVAGFDVLCADNTAHRWKQSGNGGTLAQLVNAGVDINSSDQVTQLHFGAAATPLCSTAPTTLQFLQWSGTCIGGGVPENVMTSNQVIANSACTPGTTNCPVYVLVNAHTLTRVVAQMVTAPSGCSPNATYGVKDLTSSTVLASVTPVSVAIYDSGALSVAMTAGHQFQIGVTAVGVGCGAIGSAIVTATYQ